MSLFGIIKSVFDNKSKLDYCGNHVYRDSVLARINNDYGYWADGNWYYYVKDYQGNVRAVIDHAGV